jgi:hypothetical protein
MLVDVHFAPCWLFAWLKLHISQKQQTSNRLWEITSQNAAVFPEPYYLEWIGREQES